MLMPCSSLRLRSAAYWAAILLATTCLSFACAREAASWPANEDSHEARVARWAISHGAELNGFQIGRACPTCLRGVIATKDLEYDDVIERIPLELAVRMKITDSALPAEHARDLLDRMHNDPSFNATWGPFWSSQPGPDGVFTSELYTDEHLEMLQTPELEWLSRTQRDGTEAVYRGEDPRYAPFNLTVPPEKVTLDVFKYVSSMLNSRMFGIERDGDDNQVAHVVPVADFFNHDDEPNAYWTSTGTHFEVRAHQDIKAGEAITFNYFQNVIHRPDMSLFFFGFVMPREEPLLPAVDLPTFDEGNAYAETPLDDSMYDDPAGEYVTREEYERLKGRLEAMGTTVEQDEALLENTTDWQRRVLLQFRIQRKRALQVTMDKIAAHLKLHDGEAMHVATNQGGTEDEGGEL